MFTDRSRRCWPTWRTVWLAGASWMWTGWCGTPFCLTKLPAPSPQVLFRHTPKHSSCSIAEKRSSCSIAAPRLSWPLCLWHPSCLLVVVSPDNSCWMAVPENYYQMFSLPWARVCNLSSTCRFPRVLAAALFKGRSWAPVCGVYGRRA